VNAVVVARSLSIVGHPAVLLPIAVPLAAVQRGAPPQDLWLGAASALAAALIVALYSLWQVHAGRWSHIDASGPAERLHLNLFLVCVLLAAALALWLTARSLVLAAGLGSSGVIVLAALALRRRMKLSLHCAFGAYAAALLWPVWPALAGLAALSLAVAWSRLQLQRHTRQEVLAGLVVGALAGLAFNLLAAGFLRV
jgi:membrane-associated phospholipid phosphatase